jgi:hypothetical protein
MRVYRWLPRKFWPRNRCRRNQMYDIRDQSFGLLQRKAVKKQAENVAQFFHNHGFMESVTHEDILKLNKICFISYFNVSISYIIIYSSVA